ncbi:MAG: HNH endonuclease [Planctomycetota bacterium]
MAVNITTVRRALTLLYLGYARVIEPETFDTFDFSDWLNQEVSREHHAIQTVTKQIRVPELIVLSEFDQQPILRVPFSRKNLFVRDNYRCQYCGLRGNGDDLGVDHVIPRSRGGASSWLNCVLACHPCNVRKGNRTPVEAGLKLFRQPAQPRWPMYLSLGPDRRRDSWKRFINELATNEFS